LEEQKLLRRVHGGAELPQDLLVELSILEKSSKNVQKKNKIAIFAMEKITEGDTIYLDAGTTTGAMIPLLKKSQLSLTIVTNSVTHASNLTAELLTVHILGGLIKKTTDSVTGGEALSQLSNYRFNIALLGANAYDDGIGAMTPDSEEAAVKALAIQQSEESFVLIDSSKLSQTSFCLFAHPDDIQVLTEKD
jgi:DeoR family fructose operon transcriptional repressor